MEEALAAAAVGSLLHAGWQITERDVAAWRGRQLVRGQQKQC